MVGFVLVLITLKIQTCHVFSPLFAHIRLCLPLLFWAWFLVEIILDFVFGFSWKYFLHLCLLRPVYFILRHWSSRVNFQDVDWLTEAKSWKVPVFNKLITHHNFILYTFICISLNYLLLTSVCRFYWVVVKVKAELLISCYSVLCWVGQKQFATLMLAMVSDNKWQKSIEITTQLIVIERYLLSVLWWKCFNNRSYNLLGYWLIEQWECDNDSWIIWSLTINAAATSSPPK